MSKAKVSSLIYLILKEKVLYVVQHHPPPNKHTPISPPHRRYILQFYIFDDKDAKKKVRRSGAQIKVQPLLGKETETADFCAASSEIDRSAEISCSGILS